MAKNYTLKWKLWLTCLLFAVGGAVTSPEAKAERLVTENFEYADGSDLYSQGSWIRYGSHTADPVKISTSEMTYSGYLNEAVGGKVTLGQTKLGEDVMIPITDQNGIGEGKLYVSFLVNVKDLGEGSTKGWFMAFIPETKNGMGDGKSGTENVRIYALPSSTEGKFNFAFHLNSASSKAEANRSGDYDLNTTYLVVVCWAPKEDGTNDGIKLWVNPVISAQEPTSTVTRNLSDGGQNVSTNYGGVKYVELCQGQTATAYAPLVEIDGLRVADAWADLFDVEEGDKPAIFTSVVEKNMGNMVVGRSYTFSANISGENLEDDITLTLPAGITASVASVSKEDAMAEGGAEVTFTVAPTAAENNYARIITLASGEAHFVEIKVAGAAVDAIKVANSTQGKAQWESAYQYMLYSGKAVVTAVENIDYYKEVYLQDMFGAMKINTSFILTDEVTFNVGDEITDFLFLFTEDSTEKLPVMYLVALNEGDALYTVTGTGKFKTPTEIRVADVTATTAPDYLWRLVTVKNAAFTSDNQATFAENKNFYFTDADGTKGTARVFSTSGLAGKDVPAGSVSLTGISNSAAQLTLALRGEDDIEAGGEASLSVTQERMFDFSKNATPVNVATPVMKYTVVAENLPAALPIQLAGKNPEMFSTDMAEIPAGSGTHVVTLSYNPTVVGRHECSFNIMADAVNPEMNFSRVVSAKGYDPDNMPEITITPAELRMETKPNKSVKATVTLNATNCFDYIQGQLNNVQGSAFTIDNTYLLPDSKDVVITVTFNPSMEGDYEAYATYTTTLCETPALLNIVGVCEGEIIPEERQGDLFAVDSSNPLVSYSQDFEETGHNLPLSLEGWTNVAVEGTRAWWGYQSFEDGDTFRAAKVTAYDSKLSLENGHNVEMLLVTPAFNFKDAADRRITFRLRGEYLSEGQGSKLDVMLGIPNDTEQPDFYVMDGFNIPATSDESGEWIPYEVDMDKAEDMPDTFHLAFRLKSHRSRVEPATYYIDDFKWNPTNSAVIAVGVDGSELYDVFNLQGIQVLKGADGPAVRVLPAGLYIINGKKVMLK